jgi:hypothetical protein
MAFAYGRAEMDACRRQAPTDNALDLFPSEQTTRPTSASAPALAAVGSTPVRPAATSPPRVPVPAATSRVAVPKPVPRAPTPAVAVRLPQSQFPLLTRVLAALVVIQAVPTGLWIASQLPPPATAAQLSATRARVASVSLPLVAPIAPRLAPSQSVIDSATPVVAAQPVPVDARAEKPGAKAVVLGSAHDTRPGRVTFDVPLPMRVFADGRLLGTTSNSPIALAAGAHTLEFVNESVGYRVREPVTVEPGKTVTVRLEPPLGTMQISANPWAEIWIDDHRVGQTPLANVRTRVGMRQVVFRHPQLGERRTSVFVTLNNEARVNMDMTAK